jgi:ATP-dependent Clp protease ATP-binding subunit ClpA
MRSKSEVLYRVAVFLILVLIAGCATPTIEPVQQVIQSPPLFPPQTVMQTGDYTSFFVENQEALKSCQDPDQCTIALFNLAFLHSYPKSPYYNPQKALKYIEDLNTGAPGSPWAYQAAVWKDLVEKNIKKQIRKRPPREDSKAKEVAEPEIKEVTEPETDEAAGQQGHYQEAGWEEDRQRLENEIKSQDETIKELNRQIQRSRQIDIEIEKKERGLLY